VMHPPRVFSRSVTGKENSSVERDITTEVRSRGTRRPRLSGGWGREGVRSEARAEQRLAPGGRAALPLTRKNCASYFSTCLIRGGKRLRARLDMGILARVEAIGEPTEQALEKIGPMRRWAYPQHGV